MHTAMPRIARIDTPGLLHHVMIRGITRRKIFNNDKDNENLIERLSILLPATKTQCYAWSFLSNHAHFLLKSGPGGIAALMHRLLTGYAVSFNITPAAVSYAVQRGEKMAKERGYQLEA